MNPEFLLSVIVLSPIALFDSLDVYTFAILFYALQTPRGRLNFWTFTIAFFIGYWLSGLIIVRVGQAIFNLSGTAKIVVDIIYLSLGLLLIGIGTYFLVRGSKRKTSQVTNDLDTLIEKWRTKFESSNKSSDQEGVEPLGEKESSKSFWQRWMVLLFPLFGFGYILTNLPFAYPYLSVILIWERFTPSFVEWLFALLFYSFVFILPYIVLYVLYCKWEARARVLFEKAFNFFKQPRVLGVTLVVIGILILII